LLAAVDGGDAARRPVAVAVRLRVLEPRHRRLRGLTGSGGVQALARLRPALLALAPARLELLPGAVGVRRRGGGGGAALHPTQAAARALPAGHGAAGP